MYFDYREDRELSSELQLLKENVHRFALEVMRPAALALDRLSDPQYVVQKDSPLWPVLREAYLRRYQAAGLGCELGGMGLDGLGLQILFEELGWGDAGLAFTLLTSALPFLAIGLSRRVDLVDELVKPFVTDSQAGTVGCWAFTEPEDGGTQMLGAPQGGLGVSAEATGEGYRVRGLKAVWVSNATIATHALTYLSLRDEGPARNALFVIPLASIRISRSYSTNKVGQRALTQGDFMFHEATVPGRYLVAAGEWAERMRAALFSYCHSGTSAILTGVARAAFEEALLFSQRRASGGVPAVQHELVRAKLFDLFTRVEASRAMSRVALRRYCEGVAANWEHSIAAKVFCSQAAFDVTSRAVQLFGAAGLAKDGLIEKLFRDAQMALIEYGPNDVLTLIGARLVLEPPVQSAPEEGWQAEEDRPRSG